MALQDIRAPTLGQALRPNIWDAVALILVIGAMVLIVYGGEQTVAPLSTLDIAPTLLDYFGASVPNYMHSPDRTILDPAVRGTIAVVRVEGGGVEEMVKRVASR